MNHNINPTSGCMTSDFISVWSFFSQPLRKGFDKMVTLDGPPKADLLGSTRPSYSVTTSNTFSWFLAQIQSKLYVRSIIPCRCDRHRGTKSCFRKVIMPKVPEKRRNSS